MAGNFDRAGLGRSESEGSGGYSAKNSEGYVGKYQFGDTRLADYMKSTGVSFTKEEFRGNPVLQERVQAWHEQDILDYAIDNGLDRYFGGRIAGVSITPASLIGMGHIGGKSGMKQFVESGGEYNPSDSNGTSLSDYGMKFAGDTNVVEESLRPRSRPMVSDAGIAGLVDQVRGGMKASPVQEPMLRPRARPVVPGRSAEMVAPDVRATRTAIERLGDMG
tara:strand:+ start:690 stop:1349 length:660 start_codon:yes stop_codon:yes gene_type:complete